MARQEHAFWNQEEYDSASHKVYQPRWMWLEVALRQDSVSLAGQAIRWVTTRSRCGDAAARILDADGRWRERVSYDESTIDLELDRIPGADRPTQIVLHWYRPGVRIDALRICLDVGTFKFRVHTPSGTGRQAYVLAYSPDYVPMSFYVHFGQLLGLSLRPHGEMSAREASADILSPGRAQVTLDLAHFLARWRDNIGQRTGPGDAPASRQTPPGPGHRVAPPVPYFPCRGRCRTVRRDEGRLAAGPRPLRLDSQWRTAIQAMPGRGPLPR